MRFNYYKHHDLKPTDILKPFLLHPSLTPSSDQKFLGNMMQSELKFPRRRGVVYTQTNGHAYLINICGFTKWNI